MNRLEEKIAGADRVERAAEHGQHQDAPGRTGIAGHRKVIVNPEHETLVGRLHGMLEMEFGPMRSIMNESA